MLIMKQSAWLEEIGIVKTSKSSPGVLKRGLRAAGRHSVAGPFPGKGWVLVGGGARKNHLVPLVLKGSGWGKSQTDSNCFWKCENS